MKESGGGCLKLQYIHIILALGTFPRIFPKWQLPKGIFISDNFPNAQFPKRQLPKGGRALRLAWTREPSAAASLGSEAKRHG